MKASTCPTATAPARGPVRAAERALAPDLARGAMLLFIALANAAGVVFGGSGWEPHPHGAERVLNLMMVTFVHARAYPVFAIMFGYGLVQLARRQEAAGATPQAVRSLVLRRSLWLVVFGFAHALLLYFGDFLAAYGLIGIVATVALLPRRSRTHHIALVVWAAAMIEVLVLAGLCIFRLTHASTEQASVTRTEVASLIAPTYIRSMHERLTEWPVHTAAVLPAILIVWLGIWAARRRILEDPSTAQRLLQWVAAIGLGVAFTGGLPLALQTAGVLHADGASISMMVPLHLASGMFGGPGYVALIALAAVSVSRTTRLASLTRAIRALGQRSLSAYLLQSIAWLVLLSPYTLRLGERFNSRMSTAVVIATLVWLTSVAGAALLGRGSRAGPAEYVLRRLTYGAVARPANRTATAP